MIGSIINERMRRSAFYLVLLCALTLAVSAQAAELSAGKIIERYKKAAGGSAAKRIKSTLATGSVKTTDGATGRFGLIPVRCFSALFLHAQPPSS